jgi:hypothetical protein
MPYDYYTDMTGLILDIKVLEELIFRFLHKLWAKLQFLNLDPTVFAVQWFICILSYNLPAALVIRVWDIFFIDGIVFLFKIALAILYIYRKEILAFTDMNEGFAFCGTMASNVDDIDLLLEVTEKFNISIDDINALRNRFASPINGYWNVEIPCSSEAECKTIQKWTADYFTFLPFDCSKENGGFEFINVKDDYLDSEKVPMKVLALPVEDRLMLGVKNHKCVKETPRGSIHKYFIRNDRRNKIVMPRITLSPFFVAFDVTEIEEIRNFQEITKK